MPANARTSIEFIRGPYDGHREKFAVSPNRLPWRLTCCVSSDMFERCDGQSKAEVDQMTSFAIYVRQRRANRWVYLFTEAVSLEQILGNDRSLRCLR